MAAALVSIHSAAITNAHTLRRIMRRISLRVDRLSRGVPLPLQARSGVRLCGTELCRGCREEADAALTRVVMMGEKPRRGTLFLYQPWSFSCGAGGFRGASPFHQLHRAAALPPALVSAFPGAPPGTSFAALAQRRCLMARGKTGHEQGDESGRGRGSKPDAPRGRKGQTSGTGSSGARKSANRPGASGTGPKKKR